MDGKKHTRHTPNIGEPKKPKKHLPRKDDVEAVGTVPGALALLCTGTWTHIIDDDDEAGLEPPGGEAGGEAHHHRHPCSSASCHFLFFFPPPSTNNIPSFRQPCCRLLLMGGVTQTQSFFGATLSPTTGLPCLALMMMMDQG
jgi:hypothetical protein